jgi:thioesterase domain-containing protein
MLLNGGRLVLSPENSLLDTDVLKQELYDKQISVLFITTGWFNQLVDTDISVFAKLSAILTGGEKMSEKHVERFRSTYPDIKISNIYGPTENTTFSLSYPINSKVLNMSTPIGRPLNNRTAYILDAAQQLVPVGVVGELYVGGAGVSRGYLNRPELTEERFVPHPFNAGEKIYKTGDLARWLADGSIEYLGRVDDQVKVRGFRIELGEIESVLLQSTLVNQTVVIAKTGDNGYKRLIGYVVPSGTFDRDGILDYLKNRLPEYMVPSLLIELEKLPITTNGKIDKKALPDPDSSDIAVNEYVAPRTVTEQKLADIWKELLDMEQVGVHDNFFESGGNSLLAIHLISVIRKGLTADLAISDIFDYPTIGSLAAVLDQRALAAAVSQRDNRHVLLLNKGQQETPVFFIPGGNGICDGYSVLGEAVQDSGALYGLQMMGIFEGETPLDNIPAIAAQNIIWMKQVQPKGPYRLIGHSLGGQIGYEMTRQLEEKGEQVETLFVLDTHVAPKRTILGNDELFESLVEAFELYKIIGKPHPEWMSTLKAALSKLQPKETIPFVMTFMKEHVKEEKEHLGFVLRMFNMAAHSLFMEYRVEGKIDTALTIVKSAARITDDNDAALGWAPFATDVKTYTAPGDHISMTKEEGASVIARYLKEQLNNLKPHHQ